MIERILIAGHGGQGVILIGKIIAEIAVKTFQHVTFFPCYSVEVRGGTSNCQVVLSDEEISSPTCEIFDTLILMNQPSTDKFIYRKHDKSLILVNSSMAKVPDNISATLINATELANTKIGDSRSANFIILGAYIAKKNIISSAEVESEILHTFKEKGLPLIQSNLHAFKLGLSLLQDE